VGEQFFFKYIRSWKIRIPVLVTSLAQSIFRASCNSCSAKKHLFKLGYCESTFIR